LGTVYDRIQSIEQRLLKNFQTQIADYLDLKQLSKNKDCIYLKLIIHFSKKNILFL
jgi:hypothetical protein